MRPKRRESSGSKKAKSSPAPGPVGRLKKEKVLARWTDGLLYIGKVLRLSQGGKSYMVEFEDKSLFTVLPKDLLEEKSDTSTACHVCGDDTDDSENALVACKNCDRAYHTHCHVPTLDNPEVGEDFVCRICVFAACAQVNGAKLNHPMGSKFKFMKHFFPYDPLYLVWDANHLTNVEQTYCYCGGPGQWYNKMLQCCRCRQWFHEACVHCLKDELLIGDRFYIFACSRCNEEEFVFRMDMSWYDIVCVTLFHMTMTYGTKYLDLDEEIIPFLMNKMESFGLKKLLNGLHDSVETVRKELVKILTNHRYNEFCCGAEVKKKCTWYGLQKRIPPTPPSVHVPNVEQLTESDFEKPYSGKRSLFTPSHVTTKVPYVFRGAHKVIPPTLSAKVKECKLARVKSEHNYCSMAKSDSTNSLNTWSHGRSEKTLDTNNNSPAKREDTPVRSRTSKSEEKGVPEFSLDGKNSSPSSEPPKPFWSLDVAIPILSDFSGPNHPFLTEFEQEGLRQQRNHLVNHLSNLAEILKEDENATVETKPDKPCLDLSSPNSRRVHGFKGELQELVSSALPDVQHKKATPQKKRKLSASKDPTPEKHITRLSPGKNGISTPPRPSHVSDQENSGKDGQTYFINGVRISPVLKGAVKNGLSHSVVDKAVKRQAALSKCLKQLTPTCGFHFPVLDENHPATSSIKDSEALPPNDSAATDARSKRRGVKRKRDRGSSREKETVTNSESDSVRRSHRNRQAVARFEPTSFENFPSHAKLESNEEQVEAKYDILALRVRPDNNTVEYLIDWSQ